MWALISLARLLSLLATLQFVECDADGQSTSCDASSSKTSSKYCIIGAGPAGVQMGHLMSRAGRDYTMFERGHRAGRFFNKYPVHRKLNSYNRRYTRTSHGEFRLRHDWHTLLEHDDVPRFGNWTRDFFPQADVYVKYLDAFQKEQEEAGRVKYCHNVAAIRRLYETDGDLQYELTVNVMEPCTADTGWDGMENLELGKKTLVHRCQVLVMADGMWNPTSTNTTANGDWLLGAELAVGYDDLGAFNGSDFEGKSVLILGFGNAAFETSDAVRDFASDTVIFGRGGPKWAQDIRYVGGIRAQRGQIVDATALKSLEAVVAYHEPPESAGVPPAKWALVPCGRAQPFSGWPKDVASGTKPGFRGKTPLCMLERDGNQTELIILGWADKDYSQVRKAKEFFGEKLIFKDAPEWVRDTYVDAMRGQPMGNLDHPQRKHLQSRVGEDDKKWKIMMIEYKHLRGPLTEEQRILLAELTALTKGLQRRAYELDKSFDVVLRCWGWTYDTAPFDKGNIQIDRLGKIDGETRSQMYPEISSTHESVSAKDVFFVGANAHGLDRLRYKASGGFVHGYRYTTRTVFRTLEEKYENVPRPGVLMFPWPQETPTGAIEFPELLTVPMWEHLLSRILFSAASYEMIGGSLVDGIVFDATNKSCRYIEEVPEDYFHANNEEHWRMTFGFYGAVIHPSQSPFLRIPEYAPQASPFHAVLEFFPKGDVTDPKIKRKRTLGKPDHPSAEWQKSRRSKRFHFKADRLTDYTTASQVPLLDMFLRDIEKAVLTNKQMTRKYHELYD